MGELGCDTDAFAFEFDLNDDVNAWKDVLLDLNVPGRLGGGSSGSSSSCCGAGASGLAEVDAEGNDSPSSLAPAPVDLNLGEANGMFSESSSAILIAGE